MLCRESREKLLFKNFKVDFKAQLLIGVGPPSRGLVYLGFVAAVAPLRVSFGFFLFSLYSSWDSKFTLNICYELITILGK
jgi:hypothetical protein